MNFFLGILDRRLTRVEKPSLKRSESAENIVGAMSITFRSNVIYVFLSVSIRSAYTGCLSRDKRLSTY